MDISNATDRSDGLRAGWRRRAPVLLNVPAAVLMLAAVAMPARPLDYLYPEALAWVPAAAFGLTALSRSPRVPDWLALVALGLNVAALVLCAFTGIAAATYVDIGRTGIAFAVAGAGVAAWNLLHLSRSLEYD